MSAVLEDVEGGHGGGAEAVDEEGFEFAFEEVEEDEGEGEGLVLLVDFVIFLNGKK